ncbi:DNA-binding transcriptional regulator IlvY [Serratia plymuthica]|uniref:DNA-binding transcriptional regulator IlvY n=1 Tax=Serratia plymuthica TaxID=82996 RepID=A0A2X4V2X0_SERPL|nr:DNA-binding transcriptional regulator IlvY [Serratia plymuthica]
MTLPTRSTKVQSNEADLGIAGRPETLPTSVAFTKIGEIPLVLIAPALPCAVRSQAFAEKPDWATIPFILRSTARRENASNCGSAANASPTR